LLKRFVLLLRPRPTTLLSLLLYAHSGREGVTLRSMLEFNELFIFLYCGEENAHVKTPIEDRVFFKKKEIDFNFPHNL